MAGKPERSEPPVETATVLVPSVELIIMLLRFYLRMLEKHPVITMSLGTGTLMACGDVIAQTAIEKKRRLEVTRTLRFFGFGALFGGPTLRLWYRTLDRVVPANASLRPLRMMLLDQAFFAPFFLTIFWTSMGVLRGERRADILLSYKQTGFLKYHWLRPSEVDDNAEALLMAAQELVPITRSILAIIYNFPTVLFSNYKVWPAAQLFNFYVIPLQHRVLFVNTVALGWNTYMAWKAEQSSSIRNDS